MTYPAPPVPDPSAAGPFLYFQGTAGGRMQLSALTVRPAGAAPPRGRDRQRAGTRAVSSWHATTGRRSAMPSTCRGRATPGTGVDGATYPVDPAV